MQSLFPKLEIYKTDADVSAGDISEELVREVGELFKKHGFFIRFLIQSDQEQEQESKPQGFVAKLRWLFKNE